jgi:hypothetical protein
VSFVAVVQSNGVPVTSGTVTFSDGTNVLATGVPLDSNGHAVLTTTALPAGTTFVVATYSPSPNYQGSASAGVQETVTPYSTTTSLALVKVTTVVRRRRTTQFYLTATVSDTGGGPAPSGVVTFQKKGRTVATVSFSGGVARFSVGRTAPRRTSFVALFAANATFSGSTSNTLKFR